MENTEKLVWEFRLSEGWCVLSSDNLDENGNLKGVALESQQDSEIGQMFRQIPASQVGKGDSTGKTKIMLDVDHELPL